MIDLGLDIDDLKALRTAVQETIQTNVESMDCECASPLTKIAHETYTLCRLRDELMKIDEGDTATNEYALSNF